MLAGLVPAAPEPMTAPLGQAGLTIGDVDDGGDAVLDGVPEVGVCCGGGGERVRVTESGARAVRGAGGLPAAGDWKLPSGDWEPLPGIWVPAEGALAGVGTRSGEAAGGDPPEGWEPSGEEAPPSGPGEVMTGDAGPLMLPDGPAAGEALPAPAAWLGPDDGAIVPEPAHRAQHHAHCNIALWNERLWPELCWQSGQQTMLCHALCAYFGNFADAGLATTAKSVSKQPGTMMWVLTGGKWLGGHAPGPV